MIGATMVQGIGGTNTGSIQNTSFYKTFYNMYLEYCKKDNANLSFEKWLILNGYSQKFHERLENYLETGDEHDDSNNADTITANRYISSGYGAIYQSLDEDTCYEFDWATGEYKILQGKEQIASALGIHSDKNFDTITFGYNTANITDYTFGGLDDGQDSTKQKVNSKYFNIKYTNQEFDIHYILNALLMDPNDPQYKIAKGIFDDLCKNMSQWLPDSEAAELDEIAAKHGTNSAEYKAKLQEVLLKNLDQANEWVEDHKHVENTSSLGGVIDDTPVNGSGDGSDNVNGSDNKDKTTTVPTYDRKDVVYDTDLYDEYSGNITTTCSDHIIKKKGGRDAANESWQHQGARNKFSEEARKKLETIATSLKAQLQAQMGENYTTEIDNYIEKAIRNTIEYFLNDQKEQRNTSTNEYKTDQEGLAFIVTNSTGRDKGRWGYNNQKLIDHFFDEFDSLYKNGGKTDEQVKAEQEAAEKKAAEEKDAYKALNSLSISALAKEAKVPSTVTAVNVSSAADIQADAEEKILEPIISKIKAKMQGKNIPSSDLTTILNNATNIALADCTSWASTTNNYSYTIDSSMVISKFEDAVKDAIKQKGYEF
jgi:hypothetical protein